MCTSQMQKGSLPKAHRQLTDKAVYLFSIPYSPLPPLPPTIPPSTNHSLTNQLLMTKTQDITIKTATRSLQSTRRKLDHFKDPTRPMDNIQDSRHQARGSITTLCFHISFYTPYFSNVLTAIIIANYIQQDIRIKKYLATRIPILMDYNSYSKSHLLRFDFRSDPPFAPSFAKFYFSETNL